MLVLRASDSESEVSSTVLCSGRLNEPGVQIKVPLGNLQGWKVTRLLAPQASETSARTPNVFQVQLHTGLSSYARSKTLFCKGLFAYLA